jgi:hypothetical protein
MEKSRPSSSSIKDRKGGPDGGELDPAQAVVKREAEQWTLKPR